MKKLLFVLAVALSACHSTTEADLQAADSAVVKSVDSVQTINDSLKVDSTKKIVDTLKK